MLFPFRREAREGKEGEEAPCQEKQDESESLHLISQFSCSAEFFVFFENSGIYDLGFVCLIQILFSCKKVLNLCLLDIRFKFGKKKTKSTVWIHFKVS